MSKFRILNHSARLSDLDLTELDEQSDAQLQSRMDRFMARHKHKLDEF